MPDFMPSKRLHDLFERFVEMESETSDSSTSIDYEALAFMDLTEVDIYQNLQKVWSMCVLNGDDGMCGYMNDTEDDIDLDIDYDALVAPDVDIGSDDVFWDGKAQEYHQAPLSDLDPEVDLGDVSSSSVRLAMSMPAVRLHGYQEEAKKTASV